MSNNNFREQIAIEKEKAHTVTKEMLIAQIDAHEVISFDIFDTLLCRKVLLAEDVFDLISMRAYKEGMHLRDFRKLRVEAQDSLGLTNPDIYAIYDNFQKITGVADAVKERLIQLEFETELDVLIPREAMLEVYHYAVQTKEVYIVSDMYLPQSMLEAILDKNQINSYKSLIVSCEEKKLKLQGLFEALEEKEHNKKILHIGDHEIYDGECARQYGIDTLLVCSPWELMQRSSWGKVLSEKPSYINNRSLMGLMMAKMFNSPFELSKGSGSPRVKDCYAIGYSLFGPIITAFMDWFLNKIKNKGYDGILFAARDGFLIQQLYQSAKDILGWNDMPTGYYFQTSRKAAMNSDMANEAVINMLIGIRDTLSPEEVLNQLFGLNKEELLPFPEDADWDLEIYNYVWQHQEQIFRRSAEMRKRYFKHMGNLELKIGGKYVFYDFVSSGTCQKVLNKIVPFELQGLYFGWNSQENKSDYMLDSWYGAEPSFFLYYYKMLELFMTSNKPSLSGFDEKGNPILMEENRTQEELERVATVHGAIREYFEDFMKYLYIPGEEIDINCSDKMLSCIMKTDISKLDFDLYSSEIMDDWKRISKPLNEILGDYAID